MKALTNWLSLPTACLLLLVTAGVAQSQSITIAATSNSTTLNGTSGGAKKDTGCAGFIAAAPNHTIRVTEDSNLRFALKGSSTSTLLITGDKGQNFCVQALSDGNIEIPGRWNQGSYSVFIGDRNQGQVPYVLLIEPMQ